MMPWQKSRMRRCEQHMKDNARLRGTRVGRIVRHEIDTPYVFPLRRVLSAPDFETKNMLSKFSVYVRDRQAGHGLRHTASAQCYMTMTGPSITYFLVTGEPVTIQAFSAVTDEPVTHSHVTGGPVNKVRESATTAPANEYTNRRTQQVHITYYRSYTDKGPWTGFFAFVMAAYISTMLSPLVALWAEKKGTM